MTQWTVDNPSAGDMESLYAVRQVLDERSRYNADLAQSLIRRVDAMPVYWRGDAADAWAAKVSELPPRLNSRATAVSSLVVAIDRYILSVEAIREEEERIKAAITAAIQDAADEQLVCTFNTLTAGYVCTATLPGSPLVSQYESRLARLRGELVALSVHRTAADNAMTAAAHNSVPATWPAKRMALAEIGITDPADMSPKRIAAEFATYATALIDAGMPLTDEQLAAITALFAPEDGNSTALDALFDALGGSGTRDLINLIGSRLTLGKAPTDDPMPALLAAQAVKNSLANVSQRWTPSTADRFAVDALTELTTTDLSALGYLFSGPPWMGPNLANATAITFDALARNPDTFLLQIDTTPGTTGGAVALALWEHFAGNPASTLTGQQLADALNSSHDTSWNNVRDPAGRIFETLGHYPDHATAFLTDKTERDLPGVAPTVGEERIAYWFGKRDWSLYDGFTGPTALLLGSQASSDGAPVTAAADPDRYAVAAAIAGRVLTAASGNDAFTAANLADRAAAGFAQVIGQHFDIFSGYPMTLEDEVVIPDGLTNPVDGVRGPWIPRKPFSALLAKLLAHDTSSQILDAVVLTYSIRQLDGVSQSGDPAQVLEAWRSLAMVQGYFQGARSSVEIGAAGEASAAVGNTLAALGIVAALVPGTNLAAAALLAVTGAVANVVNAATVQDLIANVEHGEDALKVALRVELVQEARAAAGLDRDNGAPELPVHDDEYTQDAATTLSDYTDRANEWYASQRDQDWISDNALTQIASAAAGFMAGIDRAKD